MKYLVAIITLLIVVLPLYSFEFIEDIYTFTRNEVSLTKDNITYSVDPIGVSVLDYTNPLNSNLISIIKSPNEIPENIYITDNILWIEMSSDIIYYYDISVPETPILLNSIDIDCPFYNIQTINKYDNILMININLDEDEAVIKFYDFSMLPDLVEIYDQFDQSNSIEIYEESLYYVKSADENINFGELRKVHIDNLDNEIVEYYLPIYFSHPNQYTFKIVSDVLYLIASESIKSYSIQDSGFVLLDSLFAGSFSNNVYVEDNIIFALNGYNVDIRNPSNLSIFSTPIDYMTASCFFKHCNYIYYGESDGITCFSLDGYDSPDFVYIEPRSYFLSEPLIIDDNLYFNTRTGYYHYPLNNNLEDATLTFAIYDDDNYPLPLDNLPANFVDGGNVIVGYIENNDFFGAKYDLAFFERESYPELNLMAYFHDYEPVTDLLFEDNKVYGIFNRSPDGLNVILSFVVFNVTNEGVEIIGETDITQHDSRSYYNIMKTDNYITYLCRARNIASREYYIYRFQLNEDNMLESGTKIYTLGETFIPLVPYCCINENYMYFTEQDTWSGNRSIKILDMTEPTSPITNSFDLDMLVQSNMMIKDDVLYTKQTSGTYYQSRTVAYSLEDPLNLTELYNAVDDVACFNNYGFYDDRLINRDGVISMYSFPNITANDDFDVESTHEFSLINYPNPFNPETTISYSIPKDGKVLVSVYNLKGQKVKQLLNDHVIAGRHKVVWDGTNSHGQYVSSGLYFVKIKHSNINRLHKMMLMK